MPSNWAQAMHALFGRSPEQAEAQFHCQYCHWEGTCRITESITTLCPKCDMPLAYRIGDSGKELVPTTTPINLRQVRGAHSREALCWEHHPLRPYSNPPTKCIRPRGHTGAHYAGHAFTTWEQGGPCVKRGVMSSSQDIVSHDLATYELLISQPQIKPSVEKVGRGMIVATLTDNARVALEFRHGKVHKAKRRVRWFTEAKLYRLMLAKPSGGPDADVVSSPPEEVKALANSAHVECHPVDMTKGRRGGRRAALIRLLCDHNVHLGDGRCVKCGAESTSISALALTLNKADRALVWRAYWDAVASRRVLDCGCQSVSHQLDGIEFTPCELHTRKKTEAA